MVSSPGTPLSQIQVANIGEVSSPGTPLTRVQVANSSSQQPRNTSYTDTGGQQELLAAQVPLLHGYKWSTGAISSPFTPHTQVQVAYSSSQQPRYTSYTGTCSLQQRSTSQVHLLHGYRWPTAAINSPGKPITRMPKQNWSAEYLSYFKDRGIEAAKVNRQLLEFTCYSTRYCIPIIKEYKWPDVRSADQVYLHLLLNGS